MAGMDILSSAGRSATGAIVKAYIKFNNKEMPEEIIVTEADRSAGKYSFSNLAEQSTGLDLRNNLTSIKDKIKSKFKAGSDTLEVHFNPSQVSFQARPGRKVQKQDYAKKQKGEPGDVNYTYVMAAPRITMTIPLIFQDFERSDAFMMEKFSDPTAMARAGITSAAEAITKDTYSVRPIVEGMIAAMQHHYRKLITFAWGDMFYTGILNSISAEYTMFNISGNPIRATVTLNMILTPDKDTFAEKTAEKMEQSFQDPWESSYNKLAGGDKGYTNFGSKVDKAGNLVNLKL